MNTPHPATAISATGATIDHLVVMAASLEQGAAWCEATLGVTPGAGGEHPLMGTHNRLLKIATNQFQHAYLEIIAINSGANNALSTRARRWFDMDDPVLSADVVLHGPRLIHWVAAVPDINASVAALAALGLDRGSVLQASRQTPSGLLQWQISVRDDGQRLMDGCLPTLIQWGDSHPTERMPDSGITLQALQVQHPQEGTLQEARRVLDLQGIAIHGGPPQLRATLLTPKGLVTIHS